MATKALISIGEVLIDFIPMQVGCEFDEVENFSPKIGGAPANVCGAYARLGGKARLITQIGNDPFGKKIVKELQAFNVDISLISATEKANTALAFVSLSGDGNRTFSFYRKPSADMLLDERQIKEEWFEDIFALHFCSVSLGDFPMKKAHRKAIEYATKNNALISFDPNLRFSLWDSKDKLKKAVDEFIPLCDILKISDEELEFISDTNDINKALPSLFSGRVKLIVYTCGSKGAYAFTKKSHAFAPCESCNAIDTTGAGDGFIGSFLHRLSELSVTSENIESLNEKTLFEILKFSNRFCGISVTKAGAIASYPTIDEM